MGLLLTEDETRRLFLDHPKIKTLDDLTACLGRVKEAQLKKVAEWGEETCPHHARVGQVRYKRECGICWQALLNEVE